MTDVLTRLHVVESGDPDGQPMLFVHGFGCDHNMWRLVAPRFDAGFRVIRFDLAGAGRSGTAYHPERHAALDGFAEDVVDLCAALDLRDVVLVGHSVAAMIGVLAHLRAPEVFSRLVLVGPSPCYLDDPPYLGGFSPADIEGLLDSVESNYLGWSRVMAPMVMGNPDRPELGEELTDSFCRMDPDIAHRFARTTFLSDNRQDLPRVSVPTLVVQCREDVIAPMHVGEYVAGAIPGGELVVVDATGHCPQLSAPDETVEAISSFLRPEHDRAPQ